MRSLLLLLLFTAPVQAQRYASRPAYSPARSPASSAARNLASIQSRARVDRHEYNHFRNAIDALARFEERSYRGQFDRGALDRAISNMQDLAQADQLHPRDRAIIRRDLDGIYRLRSSRW